MTDIAFLKEPISLPPMISVTAEAESKRNVMAAMAQGITAVTSSGDNEMARLVVVSMRQWVKEIQGMGLSIRRPINEFTAQVKRLEDDHIAPLLTEIARLEALATNWLESEQRRVTAAEQTRKMALLKAETERISAEEAARKAAGKMQTEAGLTKALEAEQKAVAAEEKVQTIIAAPMPAMEKARGQSLRRVMKWKVTDLAALYAAKPSCVKLEPRAAAIAALCVPEMPTPGLECWWETASTFTTR